jgi:hypothetical protein
MDDFLAARPQIHAPRQGQTQARAPARSPFGEIQAEVRTAQGKTDPSRAPEIETVVVNGRIRRIHVHCKCGEEIILHCDYPQ